MLDGYGGPMIEAHCLEDDVELVLPRLVGTREAVNDLLVDQEVPQALAGERVLVLCRRLASASTSFADQLVKTVLVEREASELVLVGAPVRFADHVLQS